MVKKDQIILTNDNKIKKFLLNLELVIKKYNIDINLNNIKINLENNNKENILNDLKNIKKTLNVKIKVKDKMFVMEQITKSIETGIENMEDNKKEC